MRIGKSWTKMVCSRKKKAREKNSCRLELIVMEKGRPREKFRSWWIDRAKRKERS